MSGAQYEALYDLGYSISAGILGKPYAQYRANGANNPTALSNMVGNIDCYLTVDAKLMGAGQLQYGKTGWYGAFERGYVNLGDYVIGDLGTFIIVATSYPGPCSLVQCNRTLTITRPNLGIQPGVSPYSGDTTAAQAPVLAGWPASLILTGSGVSGKPTGMKLPSDGKFPVVTIILPITAPDIQFNDVVSDDLGNRYYVSMAELTQLGWRLTAEQVSQ